MECLNAFLDYRTNLISWYSRTEDNVIMVRQQLAEWCSYHKKPIDGAMKKFIRYQVREGKWYKVSWKGRDAREKNCKILGDEAFEADVNPITRTISDAKEITIQKPRRLYVDLETDSRVPFSQSRLGGARILCWAAADDDGNVFSSILKEENDEDEQRIVK